MCLCSVYPRKSRERVCDRQELVGEERKERGEERKTAEIIAGLLFLGVSAEMAALHLCSTWGPHAACDCECLQARQNPSQGAV